MNRTKLSSKIYPLIRAVASAAVLPVLFIYVMIAKPDYALISAGRSNFNHPNVETVRILNRNKIKTISTKNFGFANGIKSIPLYATFCIK